MAFRASERIREKLFAWLTDERESDEAPLCNYDRLRAAIRPCDVVLIEGRSHVADIIQTITQSPWSHAALYIGRLNQIDDDELHKTLRVRFSGDGEEPLVIESQLGHGVIVAPLGKYENSHIRICRPRGLSQWDALKVIDHAVRRLGEDYDVRQIFDLARFFFPYPLIPRRWRSSLFEGPRGKLSRSVCSTMLAEAFMAVKFPIIPVVQRGDDGELRLFRRNTRIFTPRDFDNSPYFEVVKYPLIGHDDLANYRNLPWDDQGLVCNADGDCFLPQYYDVKPEISFRLRIAKTLRRLKTRILNLFNGLGAPFLRAHTPDGPPGEIVDAHAVKKPHHPKGER